MDAEDPVVYDNYSFYSILGVQRTVNIREIQSAFRNRVHEYKDDNKMLVDACRAYYYLSVPERKKKYDATGKQEIFLSKYHTLQRLAEEDMLEEVKKYLKKNGGKINGQDENGHTALYVASRTNRLEIMKWLIEHCADPDIQQRTQSTALHTACFYGHTEAVELLLNSGANTQVKNQDKLLPIHEVWHSSVPIVTGIQKLFKRADRTVWQMVISFDNQMDDIEQFEENFHQFQDLRINEPYFNGQTLLHCACKKGKLPIVQFLIEQGAIIDIPDLFGNTPLHFACFYGQPAVVQLLFQYQPNTKLTNCWGNTPENDAKNEDVLNEFRLQRAMSPWQKAECGDTWWFDNFYCDSQINAQDVEFGRTALYIACREGRFDLVKLLVSKGASMEIPSTGRGGSYPLHAATYYGYVEIVKFLLRSGANPFSKNGFGLNAFGEVAEGKISEETKQQLKEIFNEYTTLRDADNDNSVYNIQVFNANNVMVEDMNINPNTTFGELVAKLDKNYKSPEPGKRGQNIELPFIFLIGSNHIRACANSPILQIATKYRNSLSSFIDFPLAIKYVEIEKFRDTQNFQPKKRNGFKIESSQKILVKQMMPVKRIGKEQVFLLKHKYENINKVEIIFGQDSEELALELIEYETETPYPVFAIKNLSRSSYTNVSLPRVNISLIDPKLFCNLYTYERISASWFGVSSTQNKKTLPALSGIYAIVTKVQITPEFCIFQDLLSGDYINKTNIEDIVINFKLPEFVENNLTNYTTAYHGTSIEAIESIVTDGLIKPGMLTVLGMVIKIPADHVQRGVKLENIDNFADAIFLSPSIYYSSLTIYAKGFHYNITKKKKFYVAVLECLVEKGKYQSIYQTTKDYQPHKGEDPSTMEMRVLDPTVIHVRCLHLRKMMTAYRDT